MTEALGAALEDLLSPAVGTAALSGGVGGAAALEPLVREVLGALAEGAARRGGPVAAGAPAEITAAIAKAFRTASGPAALDRLTELLAHGSADPADPACAAHLHCPPLGPNTCAAGTSAWLSCDNVDPSHTALSELIAAATPRIPAIPASPFDVRAATSHGLIICSGAGPVRTMSGLVEKPDPVHAAQLAADYGPDNLRLLLGRVRLTPGLPHYLSSTSRRTAGEPRLSLALAAYARHHRIHIVTSRSPMIDLGAPDAARTAHGKPPTR
ncbi:hypothetical protein ACFXBB_11010 [Streptomyces scopuliridis]|uniref:hypothetical protein n=1 Tax=Streptomyces scopuliridis TaxID=452529 RepID=UPI003695100D